VSRKYVLQVGTLCFAGALFLSLASIIHPGRSARRGIAWSVASERLGMDSRTAAIFSRSCADCHSDGTRWPWYSNLPPASWLIERDVHTGQQHFDASSWSSYSVDQKREILADIARVISNREMPISQYLLLHRRARLSDLDRDALLQWARVQRRILTNELRPVHWPSRQLDPQQRSARLRKERPQ